MLNNANILMARFHSLASYFFEGFKSFALGTMDLFFKDVYQIILLKIT